MGMNSFVNLFPGIVHNPVIGTTVNLPVSRLCGVGNLQVRGGIRIDSSDLGVEDGRLTKFTGLE
jgi:hypothetical protein